MKIFDLHNDALTTGGKVIDSDIIYAIWTSKLTIDEANKLLRCNKDKLIGIEDCGIFNDNYQQLLNYNILYAGLTWNSYNGLAGGAYSDERLTIRGKQMISFFNRSGIVVDLAHLNEKSFFKVAEYSEKIICSHTCFSAVNKHPRNLTEQQISVIIGKRGIVGLCFVGDFLGEASISGIIRHIDWFLSRFGDKNLAIGTDFFGTTNLPKELKSYENFDKLVLAMIRQGYSDSTISRILYANAAAYFYDS